MRRSFQLVSVLSLALLVFVSGCDFEDRGLGRSVVEVVAVNDGAPFVDGQYHYGSDKAPGGGDDFIPAGHVSVTVSNRDYNAFINAPDETPYGQFNVQRVSVEWVELVANSPAALLGNRTFDFSVSIPKDAQVTFNVMLVTFEMKEQAPLLGLRPAIGGGNSDPSFVANARVTFTGSDSGAPENLYSFQAFIPVEFIGVIVD